MKKITAIIVSLMMVFAALPVFADGGENEKALLTVKSKVDITEDMTEFEYSKNTSDGKDYYYFQWSDEDGNKNISVAADSEGRIENYYSYDESLYSEEKIKLIRVTNKEAEEEAEKFVRKAFPEMYESDIDSLRLDGKATSSHASGASKRFTVTFDRYYRDVRVFGNSIEVSIYASNDMLCVTNVYSTVDYDASFDESECASLTEENYRKASPLSFYYKTVYGEEESVKLVYSAAKEFISEKTGEKIEYEGSERYFSEMQSAAGDESGGYGANMKISPREQAELSNMDGLLGADEAEQLLRAMPELDMDGMKRTYSNTYKNTYGAEGYFISQYYSDEENDISLDAQINAETGEIISVYRYEYGRSDKATDAEKAAAVKAAKAFAEKMQPEKIKECETVENETGISAVREVNAVRYPANYINCAFDAKSGKLSRYTLEWDADVSGFTDQKGAMSEEAAYDRIFDLTEAEHVWVSDGKVYQRALTIGKEQVIDALSGENLGAAESAAPEYTDISGHWAEEMIEELKNQGIYLDGDTFRPDEAITREDAAKLFGCVFYYMSFARGEINPYYASRLEITEENAKEAITRGDAFEMFTSMMGLGEVTKLDIYKPTFADSDKFQSGIGSAEILKAMGIITGDEARPGDSLTRAEAAVMVYRYLDR